MRARRPSLLVLLAAVSALAAGPARAAMPGGIAASEAGWPLAAYLSEVMP